MELRKPSVSKPVALPIDYLKMVSDVFLRKYARHISADPLISGQESHRIFDAYGEIAPDEIVLAVSVRSEAELSAKTVYASLDFDRTKEASAVLLEQAVDALDAVFLELFSDKNTNVDFFEMKNIPFEWTAVKIKKKEIFVRVDRANLALELLAERWLQTHDPAFLETERLEQEETKKRFVTGVR